MNCINKVSPEKEMNVATNRSHCEHWMSKSLRNCARKQLKLYEAILCQQTADSQEKHKQY